MNSLVAHIAVTVFKSPVPVVMYNVSAEWPFCSRTCPQIIIQSFRNGLKSFIANIGSPTENQSARHVNPADVSFVYHFNCFANRWRTAQLHTVLHNSIVFLRGFHHFTAFVNVVRTRFFNITVFTGLTCPDYCQRVPVIGCGNTYHIDILVVVNFAQILFKRYFLAVLCLKIFLTFFQNVHIGVAKMRNGNIVLHH